MQLSKIKTAVILCVISLLFYLPLLAQNIESKKKEIYSKLKCCPCKVSFESCTCVEAKEIKAYIAGLLETGIDQEEVFYKIAKKFSLNVITDSQIKGRIEQRIIKEVGKKHPRLALEPLSFSLGQVSKKQGKVSKIFKLSNQGNTPLIIKNLKTLCPCASVSLKVGKDKSPYFGTEGSPTNWQHQIQPNQSAEIELEVDFASPHVQVGELIREALITSNDPIYPEATVRIEALVVQGE